MGAYVIGVFDWTEDRLSLRMLRDVDHVTENPQLAHRWRSRQAAGKMLRALRADGFGRSWRVVNLHNLSLHLGPSLADEVVAQATMPLFAQLTLPLNQLPALLTA